MVNSLPSPSIMYNNNISGRMKNNICALFGKMNDDNMSLDVVDAFGVGNGSKCYAKS